MIPEAEFDRKTLQQVQNLTDSELLTRLDTLYKERGKHRLDKRTRGAWVSILRVLSELVDELPIQPRAVFYQVETRGQIPKTEQGVSKIQNILTKMRKDRVLSCSLISDGSREINELQTFDDVQNFLQIVGRSYRINPWLSQREAPIIGLEKEGLTGIFESVTHEYRVPLCALRGFSSIAFAEDIAQKMEYFLERGVHPVLCYFGDYDPSGECIPQALMNTLRETFGVTDFSFEQIALTPEQISEWNLPTRPLKKPKPGEQGDPRLKKWTGGEISVEIDVLKPGIIRELVRSAIVSHMDREVYNKSLTSERGDVRSISGLISKFSAGAA